MFDWSIFFNFIQQTFSNIEMSEDSKGKVENLLSELGKKIDHLIVEAKEASGDVREDVNEKIQDLKERKEKLEEEFQEFKNQERWQEAKTHFASAAEELKMAMGKVFKKGD